MVAWALRATRRRPGLLRRRRGAGARREDGEAANAGWGEGEWVVAEADESDASFLELKPEIAVITNVEMDHHSRWGSVAELRAAFDRFAAGAAARRVRRGSPGPAELGWRSPATTTCSTPARRWPASRWPGFDLDAAAAALADFPGVRRRLELKGERGGTAVYDDYAHHPTEVRAALAALRELGGERLIAVFQPHLYSRTKAFAEEFGAALAALRRRARQPRPGRRADRLHRDPCTLLGHRHQTPGQGRRVRPARTTADFRVVTPSSSA